MCPLVDSILLFIKCYVYVASVTVATNLIQNRLFLLQQVPENGRAGAVTAFRRALDRKVGWLKIITHFKVGDTGVSHTSSEYSDHCIVCILWTYLQFHSLYGLSDSLYCPVTLYWHLTISHTYFPPSNLLISALWLVRAHATPCSW